MSYNNDRKFSDNTFKLHQDKIKKAIENIYKIESENIKFEKSTLKEDNINNIDAYIKTNITNIPFQYRFQNSDNLKGSIKDYSPTIRFCRENNKNGYDKSEFIKIKDNIQMNNLYPNLLIWGLVKKKKLVKLLIVDLNKFYKDYNSGKYVVYPTQLAEKFTEKYNLISKEPKKKTNDKEYILKIKKNNDNSSHFIVLYKTCDNTILYEKYY